MKYNHIHHNNDNIPYWNVRKVWYKAHKQVSRDACRRQCKSPKRAHMGTTSRLPHRFKWDTWKSWFNMLKNKYQKIPPSNRCIASMTTRQRQCKSPKRAHMSTTSKLPHCFNKGAWKVRYNMFKSKYQKIPPSNRCITSKSISRPSVALKKKKRTKLATVVLNIATAVTSPPIGGILDINSADAKYSSPLSLSAQKHAQNRIWRATLIRIMSAIVTV